MGVLCWYVIYSSERKVAACKLKNAKGILITDE